MTEKSKQEVVPEKDIYVNSGYLFNSRVPFREKKKPLRILSAGTYQLYTWPKLPTLRPRGRVDWQIIYIAAGKGHFVLDGREVIVPAGNMILYQPKQVQDYFYFGKDKTQVWFVHFTGREIRNILKHYKIPTDCYILHTGLSQEYENLFRRMRDELVNCSWGYEEMLTYLFRELLMTMHRRMTENAPAFTTATACSSAVTGVGATDARGSQRHRGSGAALTPKPQKAISAAASSRGLFCAPASMPPRRKSPDALPLMMIMATKPRDDPPKR